MQVHLQHARHSSSFGKKKITGSVPKNRLTGLMCRSFQQRADILLTTGLFKTPAFVCRWCLGPKVELFLSDEGKLCRGSHWEFCFISTRTAAEQTCKSAVMSTVCVEVVVVVGKEGGKLWNFKWRKGRWREKGETADNPFQIAEHKN